MTQHQKELIKFSFAKMQPISDAVSDLFYSRLFEIAPYTRPLFSDDIPEQGKKLIHGLSMVINSIDQLENVFPTLKKLGAAHKTYGVTNAHYDIFASALLWTFERALGSDFTDEVRNSWISLYVTVSEAMKKETEEVFLAA